jgi:hypothetical protein
MAKGTQLGKFAIERELRKMLTPSQREDKLWSLRNSEATSYVEAVIQLKPEAIHLARVTVPVNGTDPVLHLCIWISRDTVVEIETMNTPETILSPYILGFLQDHHDETVVLRKYDKKALLDTTTFSKIAYKSVGSWQLMDKDGAKTMVTQSWVDDAIESGAGEPITAAFLERVRGSKGFVSFPTGSSPKNSNQFAQVVPKHIYEQKPKQQYPCIEFVNAHGANSCLATSLASSLHALDEAKAAKLVMEVWERDYKDLGLSGDLFEKFPHSVASILDDIGLCNRKNKKRTKKKRFDPFDDRRNISSLFVCQLKGRTGSIHHTVCFYDKYIFDPNHCRALPISRAALGLVCGDVGYGGIQREWEIYPVTGKSKKVVL